MTPPVVVDAHCHAGLGDGLTGPWDTDASLDQYLVRAREAGIGGTVLFAALTSDYRTANRAVGRLVTAHPRRFLGFAFVNPVTDSGRVGSMVDEALTWGACGIKVHWSDGRVTREVAEVARRRSLPVLYDPRGDNATVEMAARAYPDVAWIIPHLSSFADDWKAQIAFVDQLTRLPNLFGDTSGVRYFDVLLDAVRRAGAHKILFGSDGPFLNPVVEISKIHALHLQPDDAGLVLGGNVLRLTRAARTARGVPPPAPPAASPEPGGGRRPHRPGGRPMSTLEQEARDWFRVRPGSTSPCTLAFSAPGIAEIRPHTENGIKSGLAQVKGRLGRRYPSGVLVTYHAVDANEISEPRGVPPFVLVYAAPVTPMTTMAHLRQPTSWCRLGRVKVPRTIRHPPVDEPGFFGAAIEGPVRELFQVNVRLTGRRWTKVTGGSRHGADIRWYELAQMYEELARELGDPFYAELSLELSSPAMTAGAAEPGAGGARGR